MLCSRHVSPATPGAAGLGFLFSSGTWALRRVTFDWVDVCDSITNHSVTAHAVTGTATTGPARRIPRQTDASCGVRGTDFCTKNPTPPENSKRSNWLMNIIMIIFSDACYYLSFAGCVQNHRGTQVMPWRSTLMAVRFTVVKCRERPRAPPLLRSPL